MSRLIDADEAIKDITRFGDNVYKTIMDGADDPGKEFFNGLACAASVVKQVPTIQPEPQWIPVGERLPEKDGAYLVTCGFFDQKCVAVAHWNNRYWSVKTGVFAWMPLPPVWEGEQDEPDKQTN